jgi:RNA polymerase sigma-70 factor (ECF subfamily)
MFQIKKSRIKELESVIEEYQNQLFSYAFFRVGEYAAAQDIVQDVFLKFFQAEKNLSPVKNMKTYLFKSVANACIDYQRKNSKWKAAPIDAIKEMTTGDEEKRCIAEFLRIEDLLQELPAEQAEVVKLKFVDGLNFVETAEIVNASVNTVKSRYRYAIEKLKQTDKIKGEDYYE